MTSTSKAAAITGLLVCLGTLAGPTTAPQAATRAVDVDVGGDAGNANGTLELISVKPNGHPPRRPSYKSVVSDDGRYVVFQSIANLLVPGTGHNPYRKEHLYVRDTETGTTALVDAKPNGMLPEKKARVYEGGFSISADGRLIVFSSSSTKLTSEKSGLNDGLDVFLRDTLAGTTSIVSVAADGGTADGESFEAVISADGTTIVFTSNATNILPGDTHGFDHVYRYDVATGGTTLVSKTAEGGFPDGPSYSTSADADGNVIVYTTYASDIVPNTSMMGDGVRYDVASDTPTLVNEPPSGEPPDGESRRGVVSRDGSVVAYDSTATNLVEDDTNEWDVFTFDSTTGEITMLNHRLDGGPTDLPSLEPSIDADGTFIAFYSLAGAIVDGDHNDKNDIFLTHRPTDTTTLISRTPDGVSANDNSWVPNVSEDGAAVTFSSEATNLRSGWTRPDQIYLYRAD